MKILRKSDEGDETLLPVFVFLAALLVAIIVIAAGVSEMIATNVPTGYFEGDKSGYEWIGGTEVEYLTPTYGYNLTATNRTNNPQDDSDNQKLEYDWSDWDYVTVRVVYNYDRHTGNEQPPDEFKEGDDFIAVHLKKSGSWIEGDKWRYIRFDSLFNNWVQTNISYTYFTAFKTNFSLIITTDVIVFNESVGDPKADHINAFWFGFFNLRLGVFNTDDDITAKTSMWKVLGQVLTLQLPGVNPIVNAFIGIPIWAAIGFFIFTVLSRLVPFISGG